MIDISTLSTYWLILFSLYVEHFPKPGTKADLRMLKKEEENIEETSSENSDEQEEESA